MAGREILKCPLYICKIHYIIFRRNSVIYLFSVSFLSFSPPRPPLEMFPSHPLFLVYQTLLVGLDFANGTRFGYVKTKK